MTEEEADPDAEAEIAERLATDPKFCIETFFHIVDKPERKKVPFLLNPPQERYYSERTHNDLILKSRKEGFSSLIEAIWLHDCMFKDNQRAVTMSHEMESTKRHMERVKYFLDNMGMEDVEFEVELEKEDQKQIRFKETGSAYWIGTAGAKSFGRGDDITHLHLSEVAHYENQDVLTGVMDACVPNAWKVLETTANGVGEIFYRLWKAAKDPKSGSPWKPHFFAWFEDPTNRRALPEGRIPQWNAKFAKMKKTYRLTDEQINWYRFKQAEEPDPAKMPQEHPCNDEEAFLASGRPVFDLQALAEMKAKCETAPWVGEVTDDGKTVAWQDDPELGNLRVWKHPRQGRSYLIWADVGEGIPDGDFSVAQVFDRASWEQVAVWRGRLDPGTFGATLVTLGYYFNNALLMPEINNHGWATSERIKHEKYPHLLTSRELWPDDKAPKPGFPTNEKTKGLVITAGRNAVQEKTAWINDVVTIDEMMSFVKLENEKYGPADEENGHDDCVISWCGGVYTLKFLSLDETYAARAKGRKEGPMRVQSVVGKMKPRGKK